MNIALHGASMSYEYKEKDAREIVLLFLAVFLVGIYLFREWTQYYEKESLNSSSGSILSRLNGLNDLNNLNDLNEGSNRSNNSNNLTPRSLDPSTSDLTSGEAKQVLGIKVDINKAAQQDFESLPAIGPKLAQRIIEKRKELGAFKTIDDIKKVKGIGEKKFEKIKDLIDVR